MREETLRVADRYRREVFVAVERAEGIATPDEVALIFYDTPEQGKRFRRNNPDILGKVEAFNKTHLTDYVYYFGAAQK